MTMKRSGVETLSVHRNTRERHEAQQVRRDLKRAVHNMGSSGDIAGFAIVTWNKAWDHQASWHAAGTIPGNVLPEFVKVALIRDMSKDDVLDVLDQNLVPDDGA